MVKSLNSRLESNKEKERETVEERFLFVMHSDSVFSDGCALSIYSEVCPVYNGTSRRIGTGKGARVLGPGLLYAPKWSDVNYAPTMST